jgi:hypothetical protein
MSRNKERKQTMRSVPCMFLFLGLLSLVGCRWIRQSQKPSPSVEHAVVLAVLDSIACSQTSPLPPAKYRPQFLDGVATVIVVQPKFAQPDHVDLEGAARLDVAKEVLSALKDVSGETGDVLLDGAHFSCDVQAILNTKWRPGYWEAFRQFFPGGLGSVSVSKVALSASGDRAYIYSHVQWGPLQGESDLWICSRERDDWRVIHMYPVSRS